MAAHQMSVEINARDLGLHKYLGTLGLKCILVGIEELVDGIDLAAHPKRGTAAEIAQVGVTVDHHHFLIGIGVEQRVGGSNSGVVGSNDDGLHLIPLSRAGLAQLGRARLFGSSTISKICCLNNINSVNGPYALGNRTCGGARGSASIATGREPYVPDTSPVRPTTDG